MDFSSPTLIHEWLGAAAESGGVGGASLLGGDIYLVVFCDSYDVTTLDRNLVVVACRRFEHGSGGANHVCTARRCMMRKMKE